MYQDERLNLTESCFSEEGLRAEGCVRLGTGSGTICAPQDLIR